MASPSIGGPGNVGHTLDGEEEVKELTRKRAFFKQIAENSKVGAGIAADWGCESKLQNATREPCHWYGFKPHNKCILVSMSHRLRLVLA